MALRYRRPRLAIGDGICRMRQKKDGLGRWRGCVGSAKMPSDRVAAVIVRFGRFLGRP
jgi:hypothetical protein